MPFWWRRRRRFWYPSRYKRRYRRRTKYKARRRRFPRTRRRRTTYRRKRRRTKVRRKRKSLIVRQWQPDSIVLCKIKGFQALVIGAEGTQYLNYTYQMYEWVRSKFPGGGVFATQVFTLQYLYDQWKLRNNIWTRSNKYKDLCRYLNTTIVAYRHPDIDFILHYERQPPFDLTQYTFLEYHPYMLLQKKHKKILPSTKTNPKGKSKIKFTIKPPKQMLSKWFFQQQFAKYDLFKLSASAISLQYPRLGCCNENRIITILYLNPSFFVNTDWAQAVQDPHFYEPITNIADYTYVSGPTSKPVEYAPKAWIKQATTAQGQMAKYYRSISLEGGWFSPRVLGAWDIKSGTTSTRPLPVSVARYNPAIDDGKGNKIWLCSIVGGSYTIPTVTPDLIFEGYPLWLAFWGYWDYLQQAKSKSFFGLHMFVVQSPYIYPAPTEATRNFYPFIDSEFIQGKIQYDSPITNTDRKLWYPTCYSQIKTINAFCETGPYVPKLSNDRKSTWELPIKYISRFKWGGPQITDQPVENPKNQDTYAVPDTFKEAIQVDDPTKQIAASMFHHWDYRRGFLTEKALKRMRENLPSDSSLSSDSEGETPKKKKRVLPVLHMPEKETQKIQSCLLSLCEENTCQETQEETDLLKLIQQQQQHQRQLKLNLLTLIKDLKAKQRMLQLQTGVLE
nr:MAG: ORF1 [Torque teno midi virus]